MAKRKKQKNKKREKPKKFELPEQTRIWIWGILMFLIACLISLSFFGKAGLAGRLFLKTFIYLIGKTVFLLPLIFVLAGFLILSSKEIFFKKKKSLVFLIFLLLILGISGILGTLALKKEPTFSFFSSGQGGWLGNIVSWPFFKFFGFWATLIIFLALIFIGGLISFQFLAKIEKKEIEEEKPARAGALADSEEKPLISRVFKRRIFLPKFRVKEIPSPPSISREIKKPLPVAKSLEILPAKITGFEPPPTDLLETDKGTPSAGDIKINSAIIKKTLENFAIPVEMAEVNIGPTVTQYTLKPAEGVKLSKITSLSNDLALALASHPIRIEAPIPGRSLVGIEVPNRTRTLVRLRNLIENPAFQEALSPLTFVLGRDVSGNPVFADLARMPHLLVAGSTGTGKTIALNSIILSLLYQNGPDSLRFILIDPKRVEFPVYNDLPHLLCPVIYDAQKSVNSLKWLILEMERRFEVLAQAKAKDIAGYNQKISSQDISLPKAEPLPYIILIIDELADLMAARGREVEAGIVRLAQMARAVGIHLVVATQRPSVEVITGLIKANITSRITFQVASQVDSRTVLDMAGAEKLLGLGDLLFVSAEIVKPKRIQGAFVSEKEVKRVVSWIKSKIPQGPKIEEGIIENSLTRDLKKSLTEPVGEIETFYEGEDPLYEEAKKVVIEAKKASASLLQRRLRIGYARAARLIDTLEEKGVVGPADGAKPREVYFPSEESE